MDPTWYTVDLGAIVGIFLTTLGLYAALIALVRLNGLRSFSKMSSHDFAITVAIGSVIASTILAPSPSLGNGVVAVAALFAAQRALSSFRRFVDNSPVDNRPLLLMRDGQILDGNLARAQVTRDDLLSKLRSANVRSMSEVRAVVMESTGDISVLHGPRDGFEEDLLAGVDRS